MKSGPYILGVVTTCPSDKTWPLAEGRRDPRRDNLQGHSGINDTSLRDILLNSNHVPIIVPLTLYTYSCYIYTNQKVLHTSKISKPTTVSAPV